MKRRRRAALLAAIAAGSISLNSASGADKSWTFTSSSTWSGVSNWQGGLPAASDNAFIVNTSGSSRTVTLDINTPTLARLTINLSSGISTSTLSISTASLAVSGAEILGDTGRGAINQSGGRNSAGSLSLGNAATGLGTYVLSGGSLVVNTGGIFVGVDGAGRFAHSGGTVQLNSVANGFLNVGSNSGSTGTYTLSGSSAVLTVLGDERIGYVGSGTFNQSDGSHTLGTTTDSSILYVGLEPDGIGTYILSGGSLSVFGQERIGYRGTGTFNQSDGTHTVGSLTDTGSINVGHQVEGIGTFILSGGTLSVFGQERIGSAGAGTFSQTGGTHTLGADTALGSLNLANAAGSTGYYHLASPGRLTVFGTLTVGNAGDGTFNHNSGTNTLGTNSSSATLNVGSASGSTGRYILDDDIFGTARLLVFGEEFIGRSGSGVFEHNGGTHTLGSASNHASLNIGHSAGSTGTYVLNGGRLLVFGTEAIGNIGNGTFIHNSGTHAFGSVSDSASLNLGLAAGSNGTYSLNGGTLSVFGAEAIGAAGSGTFNQSAGTHTLGSASADATLYLGEFSGSTGYYSMSGGTLNVFGDERIGEFGAGTFAQTGGTHTLSSMSSNGRLFVGSGAAGIYIMGSSGPSLSVDRLEQIGGNGAGTFLQNDGTNTVGTVSNDGTLAVGVAQAGYYLLNGGISRLNVHGVVNIGDGGAGTFNHMTGTVDIAHSSGIATLTIGNSVGSTGTYLLSGGSLIIHGDEHIGKNGAGTFDQSGGFHQVIDLNIGSTSSAVGRYLLSGTGALNVAGDENIGQAGSGTFIQNGGTHTVAGSGTHFMMLGREAGGSGNYVLNNGTLNVDAFEYLGYVASSGGTFSQSGGTHTIGANTNTSIVVGFGGMGQYLMTGGTFNAIKGETIAGLNGSIGTFSQSGGLHKVGTGMVPANMELAPQPGAVGTFIQSGGTTEVTGTVHVGGGIFLGAAGVGRLIVNGGTFTSASMIVWNTGTVLYNGGSFSTGGLQASNGGKVLLSSGNNKTLRTTNYFIFGPGSYIDLSDNRMIVDYTTLGTLLADTRDHIVAGRLISSLADSTHRIGYADNAAIQRSGFGGITFPVSDYSQLLIKYTWAGDANLDGMVDIRDLQLFIQNFNGTNKFWSGGDFDYDGDVDRTDLGFLARNWQVGVGNPLGGSFGEALNSLGYSAIPEPQAIGVITLMACQLRRQRRKRRGGQE